MGSSVPHRQPGCRRRYNLSKSTATQSCFGPARIGRGVQPLTNASVEFMRHWGIITLDFESEEQLWGHHSGGKNSDEMMLAEAVKVRPKFQIDDRTMMSTILI